MPFTVVVFPSDLKNVGDIRQLQGRMIEIHGQVKEYDGRAEIILEEYRQLSGSTARIPPLPKNYDVEKKGRYSAGTFSHPKAGKKPSKKRQTAKLPIDTPEHSLGNSLGAVATNVAGDFAPPVEWPTWIASLRSSFWTSAARSGISVHFVAFPGLA